MNIEDLREFCLSVKGADESFPFFDNRILVFKVMGKMFAYVNIEPKEALFRVSVKCDPNRSVELRERYEGITNGQHTKTLTWNSIYLESDVPDDLIKELIIHSADEVIKKLPKRLQAAYIAIETKEIQ